MHGDISELIFDKTQHIFHVEVLHEVGPGNDDYRSTA